MEGGRLLFHATVLLLSIGGVFMATYMQWPVHFQSTPVGGGQVATNGTHAWWPTVILVSLDGLKPAYLQNGHLPTLKLLSDGKQPKGLRHNRGIITARSMVPVSPSLTFPNHWTLQTGLVPSSHGIIANDFHTERGNKSFYYTDPSRSWHPSWWKGTSLWERLETLDIKTANLMWPGPPITSNGVTSTYFQKYEKAWTLHDRLNKIVSWLDKDDLDRPQFICAYAPDIDSVTHSHGPDESNEQVTGALKKVDNFILNILTEIDKRSASSFVNVIVVSDHGMTSTSNNRLVYLEDILGSRLFHLLENWDGWPNVGLRLKEEAKTEEVLFQLRQAAQESEGHFRVATRNELLDVWGWESTDLAKDRVADLWILPAIGWSITTKAEMAAFEQDYRPKGNHGYHASNPDMQAFFLALGPSIRQSSAQILPPFANVEIHNLVMDLLHVAQSDRVSTNGTLGFWQEYLSTAS